MKVDFHKKALALVAQMTIDEKISQLRHDAPAIERLGIPAYNWWSEGLHGYARAGCATVFPQAIGMAASFNTDLMEQVGDVIATEGRARHHEYFREFGKTDVYQGLTIFSPNINIFRDPRWGRGHETYGEDPCLTGEMGTAFVKGLQGNHPVYHKTDATLKHYAVHSGPERLRHGFDAVVGEKDLRETYLAAFRTCVQKAAPASVMGAYNRVNGEACCASPTLLQTHLRDEMGFKGYVVSDCGAVADINNGHKLTQNDAESAALALKNGCDLNCGWAYRSLPEAFKDGLVDEATITRACIRLFEARLRLGLFAKDCPYSRITTDVVECPKHRRLNRRMATEGVVLLKNDGILPLSRKLTVAVIGPNADSRNVLLGNYNPMPSKYCTILRGMQEATKGQVLYAFGCFVDGMMDMRVGTHLPNLRDDAICVAKRADVIVMAMGITPSMEGEEGEVNDDWKGDRKSIDLPSVQLELLRELKKTGKPIVWLNVSGSCVNLCEVDASCNAVLQCFYPGAEGGRAVADILYGAVSPSGHLPVTFYKDTAELPPFEDYAMAGRTYRYFQGTPLYPFGHGLSYANVACENLAVVRKGKSWKIQLTLNNASQLDSMELIQVYLRPEKPKPYDPIRKLVTFKKIKVKAASRRAVTMELPEEAFCFFEPNGHELRRKDPMVVEVNGQLAGTVCDG